MRVISGSFRGRKLIAPKDDARPTLDRAKETLFNILQFSIAGRDVLDVFAGSGALGIESLSRGALSAVFVDDSPKSIEAIEKNCTAIGLNVDILRGDYVHALTRLRPRKFGLVFIDPPYENGSDCVTCLKVLCSNDLLTPDAIVAVEHKHGFLMPEKINTLVKFKSRAVGYCEFSFFKQETNLEKEANI